MTRTDRQTEPPPENARRRLRLADVAIGVLLIAGTALTGFNATHRWFPPPPGPDRTISYDVEAGPLSRTLGAGRRPARVVVFSDCQCGACAKLDSALMNLVSRHATISVSWRSLPLATHPNSRLAAAAAICASRQHRFAAFHSRLFATAAHLRPDVLKETAAAAGIPNQSAFDTCLTEPSVIDTIEADIAAAKHLGAEATPTIVIGRDIYVGYSPDVVRAIAAATKPRQAGATPP